MKRKQRPGGRPGPPLPYFFNLPGDLPIVKTTARMMAIECAYVVIRDNQQEANGPFGPRVMAIESCLKFEQNVHEGKQGTNDPALYRSTYIDEFLARYPTAREELLTGQIVIDPAWPDQERCAKLYLHEAVAQGFITL